MYSVNTAVKYNTSHPVENPEPVKNLPIYRIYLRSAQITTDWFSQITFPIELHDVHLLPHGSKYQIAVESLICETSGAHNRIVVLHCDDIRAYQACESITGGVRSGSSVVINADNSSAISFLIGTDLFLNIIIKLKLLRIPFGTLPFHFCTLNNTLVK